MSKKLDDLRHRTSQRAAAQAQTLPQTTKQTVDIYANEKARTVMLKLAIAADNVHFTLEQALDHGYKVVAAAAACGAMPDFHKIRALIEEAQDKIKAGAVHGR